MMAIVTMKTAVNNRPGPIPAINKRPTDSCAITPKTMNNRLGGINMPNTDDPATTPTASLLSYPCRIISGTATRVKTLADAMLIPVMAAKTALAPMVDIASPPFKRFNNACITSKVSLPTFDTETSIPISTNKGTTLNK